MKKLIALLFLLSFLPVSAQDNLVVVSATKYQVLYRGVPNYIQIGFSEMNNIKYLVHFAGGEITDIDTSGIPLPSHNFILVPGVSGRSILTVFDISDTLNPVLLQEVNFYNFDLPLPTLFVGGSMSGDHIYYSSLVVAKYPPSVMLDFRFTVRDWVVRIGDKIYEGQGNYLSEEVQNVILSVEDETEISVETNVIGLDDVERKIEGVFYRSPAAWYEEN